ncbi:serine protease [Arcanobacterium bovis]|uniref:Serine protease n=1 Tax=Arcanobacterium bovis TaxID=2529275 RepID=A0A4Q9V2C0_9ACTO|nr:serine protease [Arcanobacterium bovis]
MDPNCRSLFGRGKHTDPNVPAHVVKVHFSNSKVNPGPAYSIDSYQISPSADMALLRLSKPHKLSKYGVLSDSHQFRVGELVTLYGYGKGLHDAEVKSLRRAQLKVVGQDFSYIAGETLKMKGITGASNHGDSGGPVVNAAGEIIGVNVLGSHAAWCDPYAPSEAVDLSHYRQWVKDVAGI